MPPEYIIFISDQLWSPWKFTLSSLQQRCCLSGLNYTQWFFHLKTELAQAWPSDFWKTKSKRNLYTSSDAYTLKFRSCAEYCQTLPLKEGYFYHFAHYKWLRSHFKTFASTQTQSTKSKVPVPVGKVQKHDLKIITKSRGISQSALCKCIVDCNSHMLLNDPTARFQCYWIEPILPLKRVSNFAQITRKMQIRCEISFWLCNLHLVTKTMCVPNY